MYSQPCLWRVCSWWAAAWHSGYRRRRRAAAEVSRRDNGSASGGISKVSRAERRVLDGQGLGARALASFVWAGAFDGISWKPFMSFSPVLWRPWLFDVFQNTAFDSNTKTVLLSKQCFSKKYQNGITFKSNVFNVIFLKCVFKVLLNWPHVYQNSVSDSNTKTALLSKQCLSKKYQHGITFKANVSNVISSKWFFNVLLNWRLSVKTLFLTVIPKQYYCQKQCFDRHR